MIRVGGRLSYARKITFFLKKNRPPAPGACNGGRRHRGPPLFIIVSASEVTGRSCDRSRRLCSSHALSLGRSGPSVASGAARERGVPRRPAVAGAGRQQGTRGRGRRRRQRRRRDGIDGMGARLNSRRREAGEAEPEPERTRSHTVHPCTRKRSHHHRRRRRSKGQRAKYSAQGEAH